MKGYDSSSSVMVNLDETRVDEDCVEEICDVRCCFLELHLDTDTYMALLAGVWPVAVHITLLFCLAEQVGIQHCTVL